MKKVSAVKKTKSANKTPRKKAVSYHKKPENMSMEEWQIALRKQFAETLKLQVSKIDNGEHFVYTDYLVKSPSTGNVYKIALRSNNNSLNFCSCLDFKLNGLGTCKHIEYLLLTLQKNAKTKKLLKDNYVPSYSSIYLSYFPEREVKIRIGTSESSRYLKIAEKYFDRTLTLKQEGYTYINQIINECKEIDSSFRIYDDALQFILEEREKQKRFQLAEEVVNDQYLDNLLKVKLFPYQKEGVHFATKAGRCLIADEMGLGKTIQAIASAEFFKKEFGLNRVLIICPTSLKYQWKSEIEKFTNSKVSVIEGKKVIRNDLYKSDDSFYQIISYNVVNYDHAEINQSEPDLIILDEAQRIKNWKTKIAQNIKKLHSEKVIVLTGTPLENKLEELHSIIQVVDIFRLGALYKFLDKHRLTDETGKVIGYQGLNEIGHVLKDLMIRRTKKQIKLQLPERMDKNLFVPMTEEQSAIHSENQEYVSRLVHKWRKMGFLNEKDRQRLMIAMNTMRMVCDSTFILDQKTRHDTKISEVLYILEEYLEDPENKVVIFSQWERMTRLVASELEKRNIKYENLHGGVPSEKRKALLDNFSNDPESRIFLSTDAGGTGLNLQAASMLINLDIPWNPAVLEQRIARVYRLGQKNNVSVINFVSKGTIEERMLDVLNFKASLSEGILDKGEDAIFLDDSKFKKFMSSIEDIVDDKTEVEKPFFEDDEFDRENKLSEKEEPKISDQMQFEWTTDTQEDKPEVKKEVGSQQNPHYDLLSEGVNFLGKLSAALSEKDGLEKIVSSVTSKDEKGNVYLKVPVENEQVIKNAVSLLGSFMQMIDKK